MASEPKKPYIVPKATFSRYNKSFEAYQGKLEALKANPIDVLEVNAKDLSLTNAGLVTPKQVVAVQNPGAIGQYFAPKRVDMTSLFKKVKPATFQTVFNDCLQSKPRDVKVYSTPAEGAFAVVSNYHQLISNLDVFTAAEEAINSLTSGDYSVAMSDLGHKSAMVDFVLGGQYALNVKTSQGEDSGNLSLIVRNSETAQGSIRAELGFMRLVCSNGLMIRGADIGKMDRVIHIGKPKSVEVRTTLFDKFNVEMGKLLNSASSVEENLNQAATLELPVIDAEELTNSVAKTYLIPKARAKNIAEHLVNNQGQLGWTYYGLSQAIAEEATHWAGDLSRESQDILLSAAYSATITPLLTTK